MSDSVVEAFAIARPVLFLDELPQDVSMLLSPCLSPLSLRIPEEPIVCSPVAKPIRVPRTPPSPVLPTFKERLHNHRQQLLSEELSRVIYNMGIVDSPSPKRDSDDMRFVTVRGKRIKLWQ